MQCGFCTPGIVMAARDLLAASRSPTDDEIREGLAGNLCRCTGYQKIIDAVGLAARARVSARLIEGCAIATVDDGGASTPTATWWSRRADRRGRPRRRARRDGRGRAADRRPRAAGHAGLVNCHHHLYQHATRGFAQQATLFEWLVALYPTWGHIDAETVAAAARAGARRARPLGLRDEHRPPLHLPARRG